MPGPFFLFHPERPIAGRMGCAHQTVIASVAKQSRLCSLQKAICALPRFFCLPGSLAFRLLPPSRPAYLPRPLLGHPYRPACSSLPQPYASLRRVNRGWFKNRTRLPRQPFWGVKSVFWRGVCRWAVKGDRFFVCGSMVMW